MRLGLVMTSRCNAACTHCSTSCGPKRTEALTRSDLIRLMDEASAIEDGEPLRFDFTGGEPFLDFELLVYMVAHGSALGAVISCTTNAYWAHSRETAQSKLSTLREAGLSFLAVSVSRFHQRFVPLQRVRRALEAASELGMHTQLKGIVTQQDLAPEAALAQWKAQLDADDVAIIPVLPHLREGATLPEHDYYREAGLPEHTCPGAMVCVEPDGTAASCCAPGIPTPFLTLGSVHDKSLNEIQRRFSRLGKQKILRELGPIHFARGAIAAGIGDRLRSGYAGPCDLCLHIGTDPELSHVADEMSAAFDLSRLSQAWTTTHWRTGKISDDQSRESTSRESRTTSGA